LFFIKVEHCTLVGTTSHYLEQRFSCVV
jgi:hypothetical protein